MRRGNAVLMILILVLVIVALVLMFRRKPAGHGEGTEFAVVSSGDFTTEGDDDDGSDPLALTGGGDGGRTEPGDDDDDGDRATGSTDGGYDPFNFGVAEPPPGDDDDSGATGTADGGTTETGDDDGGATGTSDSGMSAPDPFATADDDDDNDDGVGIFAGGDDTGSRDAGVDFLGSTEEKEHKVAGGETLMGISTKYYGTVRGWKKIHEANKSKIPNPNAMKVGVVLRIPKWKPRGGRAAVVEKRVAPVVTTTGKTHTVQKGDTLSRIAKKHYGSASKWPLILEANSDTLKSQDTVLKVGQVLKIPDESAVDFGRDDEFEW
jgi:nucleoid-associated protein YgaU